MTKEEIIKYVLSSPENTNPNVLEGMLNELSNSGGGGSNMLITLFEAQRSDTYLANYETKEAVTFNDIIKYVEEGKIIQYIDGIFENSAYMAYFYSAYKQYNQSNYIVRFLTYETNAIFVEFTSNSPTDVMRRTGD